MVAAQNELHERGLHYPGKVKYTESILYSFMVGKALVKLLLI